MAERKQREVKMLFTTSYYLLWSTHQLTHTTWVLKHGGESFMVFFSRDRKDHLWWEDAKDLRLEQTSTFQQDNNPKRTKRARFKSNSADPMCPWFQSLREKQVETLSKTSISSNCIKRRLYEALIQVGWMQMNATVLRSETLLYWLCGQLKKNFKTFLKVLLGLYLSV